MLLRGQPSSSPAGEDEQPFTATVRYRTVGDMTCTGGGASPTPTRSTRSSRGRRDPDHRARRHPRRRPGQRGGHGRPQAGGLLLMAPDLLCGSPPRGSVDDGKSTLIGRLLYDSKSIFEDQLEAVERDQPRPRRRLHQPGAAHRRPAGRARAGHHHRRGLPLLRHARRKFIIADTPGTSSTPATWSPAPPPPTWR